MLPEKILLAHGNGGAYTQELIKKLFLPRLDNPIIRELADGACLDYKESLIFTTDSFVVKPIFFSGGDIGKLSVCGTVNDLVMMAAKPEYLSLALIIEEGFKLDYLKRIVDSISAAAKEAGVNFVTGDLKVVEKGSCDKVFINTSGIGRVVSRQKLHIKNLKTSDQIIMTGNIGTHGLAVLAARHDFDFVRRIKSDSAPLNGMLLPLVKEFPSIKFMRDPTRGGIATTLNEIAQGCDLGILVDERKLPISSDTKTACELLGVDPLYLANEGAALLIVEKRSAGKVLKRLKEHKLGKNASLIGELVKSPRQKVVLSTCLGTQRFIDMLSHDPLPRIC